MAKRNRPDYRLILQLEEEIYGAHVTQPDGSGELKGMCPHCRTRGHGVRHQTFAHAFDCPLKDVQPDA